MIIENEVKYDFIVVYINFINRVLIYQMHLQNHQFVVIKMELNIIENQIIYQIVIN